MSDDIVLPKISTVTSKMQVTIPVRMRRQLGLTPGQKVSIEARNGRILVTPFRRLRSSRKEATRV